MSYTINPVAYGIYKGQSQKMTREAIKANNDAAEAWRQVGEIKDRANALVAHYVAKEAEVDYLLNIIDGLVDGPDNNPAREQRPDVDEYRIPVGIREGQLPENRDVIFYNALRNRFQDESKGLKGYFKTWFDVIRVTKVFD